MQDFLDKKAYFFGFSRWKHGFVKPFFWEYDNRNIIFVNPIFTTHKKLALKKGLDANSHIYIWGKKKFDAIEHFAKEHNLKLFRVEDGFIRSVGLGSDLTQPYSLVVDDEGIYFDPTTPSLLENILLNLQPDAALLERARKLKERIVADKISKYNADAHATLDFPKEKKTALVVGQVEDDASIIFGAEGMTNKELLQKVKTLYPDRYIIYKPHPDVLSGNRKGHLPTQEALHYCDTIVTHVGMASVLRAVDEVHTMSSLTGFEGLLHGKEVFTYGVPFYAGWGLTTTHTEHLLDAAHTLKRRNVLRTLDELVAATLLLYPRYIHPTDKKRCEAEEMIEALKQQKEMLASSFWRRVQFTFYVYLSRILQKLFSLVA